MTHPGESCALKMSVQFYLFIYFAFSAFALPPLVQDRNGSSHQESRHTDPPPHPPLPITIFLPVPESTSSVFIVLICLFVPSYKRPFCSYFPICHLHIPHAFLCLGHNSLQGQQRYFQTSNTMSLCLFLCFVRLTEYNKQKVL